jgi:hypothetical protein
MAYKEQLLPKQDYYAKKGIEQGAKSLPAPTSQSLDIYESQLQSEAQRYAAGDHGEFERKQASKEKTLKEVEDVLGQAKLACDTLLGDRPLSETVSHTREQQRPVLIKACERLLDRETELKKFCALNNITEKAVYPENLLIPYLLLVPFIVVETVCNAVFYANSQGLLGGATVAFGVSLINMLSAFVLGVAFRYKNWAASPAKVLGWGALVVAVLIAIYFNAVFSAYRTEYQLLEDPGDIAAGAAAFGRAMDTARYVFIGHWPSSDLSSFVLFFLGLGLSVLAFWKGYTCDDRYPRHGALDRRYEVALNAYERELDVVRIKVTGEVQRRLTGMAAARTQLLQTSAQLDQIKRGLTTDVNALSAALKQLQRDFALVLGTYREKNLSIRPIDPPAYFAETPDLINVYASEDGSKLKSRIEEAAQRQELYLEMYSSRLNDGMRDIENEGRDLQGRALTEFVAEIKLEAQRNIEDRNLTMPVNRPIGAQA